MAVHAVRARSLILGEATALMVTEVQLHVHGRREHLVTTTDPVAGMVTLLTAVKVADMLAVPMEAVTPAVKVMDMLAVVVQVALVMLAAVKAVDMLAVVVEVVTLAAVKVAPAIVVEVATLAAAKVDPALVVIQGVVHLRLVGGIEDLKPPGKPPRFRVNY